MRLGTTFAAAIISSLVSSVASDHIHATGTDEDYKHWFDVRSDGYFYVLERHGDPARDFWHEEIWKTTLSDDNHYLTVSDKKLEDKGWKHPVTAHYKRRGKEEVGVPFKHCWFEWNGQRVDGEVIDEGKRCRGKSDWDDGPDGVQN